jgi:hypothetical protein
MEIDRMDALEWLRQRPEQFFPAGRLHALGMLPYVVHDAVLLGNGACSVRKDGDWCVVSSDVDWLRHETYSLDHLFLNVVPAPAQGIHSMRSEVLLMAFARDIWTVLEGVRKHIKGDPPPSDMWPSPTVTRAILFSA